MIQDNTTPRALTALTIAGSDSGAGAGIQADLKTFAALGVYGTSALTAITAQNTLGVRAVEELSPAIVAAQIDAVIEDIGADAVKTGMLASAAIIETVAERLRHHGITQVVVDPVMVAKSGDRLLREDAVQALRQTLLPLALVVTPNLPEAEVLAGIAIRGRAELEEAARRIAATGARPGRRGAILQQARRPVAGPARAMRPGGPRCRTTAPIRRAREEPGARRPDRSSSRSRCRRR